MMMKSKMTNVRLIRPSILDSKYIIKCHKYRRSKDEKKYQCIHCHHQKTFTKIQDLENHLEECFLTRPSLSKNRVIMISPPREVFPPPKVALHKSSKGRQGKSTLKKQINSCIKPKLIKLLGSNNHRHKGVEKQSQKNKELSEKDIGRNDDDPDFIIDQHEQDIIVEEMKKEDNVNEFDPIEKEEKIKMSKRSTRKRKSIMSSKYNRENFTFTSSTSSEGEEEEELIRPKPEIKFETLPSNNKKNESLISSGEKGMLLFPCSKCNAIFKFRKGLTDHLLTHHNQLPSLPFKKQVSVLKTNKNFDVKVRNEGDLSVQSPKVKKIPQQSLLIKKINIPPTHQKSKLKPLQNFKKVQKSNEKIFIRNNHKSMSCTNSQRISTFNSQINNTQQIQSTFTDQQQSPQDLFHVVLDVPPTDIWAQPRTGDEIMAEAFASAGVFKNESLDIFVENTIHNVPNIEQEIVIGNADQPSSHFIKDLDRNSYIEKSPKVTFNSDNEEEELICNICDMRFEDDSNQYFIHISNAHPILTADDFNTCEFCQSKFNDSKSLNEHVQNVHIFVL